MERNDAWRWLCLFACVTIISGVALADIRTTKHSFARNPAKLNDVCIFCHTPNMLGKPPEHAPLWQSSIGTGSIFTIYDDIGQLGLGKSSVGSQSVACLSCHDATQALSVNKDPIGHSSDHPFGIPYKGAVRGRANSISLSGYNPTPVTANTPASLILYGYGDNVEDGAPSRMAQHLVDPEEFRDVSQGVVEGRAAWWVSASGVSSQRKRNDLPLYGRTGEGGEENLPFIECSSCHDPHSNNENFLRIQNDGSRLCLTCHLK